MAYIDGLAQACSIASALAVKPTGHFDMKHDLKPLGTKPLKVLSHILMH